MINMLGTIWFFWPNIPLSTKEDLLSAKKKTADEAKSVFVFLFFVFGHFETEPTKHTIIAVVKTNPYILNTEIYLFAHIFTLRCRV